MEHFVTLFDSLFLPQGMALHMSMQRHIREFTLWILCVDDETHEILTQLDLDNVRLLKLSELETEKLLAVKSGRTKGEYCWTLTPFTPRFVFEADVNVARATYLDADLWFRKHPKPIFDEFEASKKQVLITDHGYAAEHDQSVTSGQYCVQFMTFTREGGEPVRKWWEERCIEWCFARFEDGKFGDQKYLDDWPERFGNRVHILKDKELALAPWNATRFPYGNSVFFHFHALRIITKNTIDHGSYYLPETLRKNVYKHYIADLKVSLGRLDDLGIKFKPQAKMYLPLLRRCKKIYRRLKLLIDLS